MPGSRVVPQPGFPLSRRELRKVFQFGPEYDFLDHYALRDVQHFKDDFDGKALDTTNDYSVAAGATATTWAMLSGGENGLLRGISGTTAATSGLQLSRPGVFKSAENIGIEVYFVPSVVTETRFEIGFVNSLPAVNTTIVNSLTTPTLNTATDAALYVFDNASSTNTSELVTVSSVSSGQANKQVCSPSQLPTAATFQHVRLECKGNNAFLWVNGKLVAQQTGTGASSAINPATAVLPVFMSHKKSDTTTSNIDIDYVRVYSDRLNQA